MNTTDYIKDCNVCALIRITGIGPTPVDGLGENGPLGTDK